MPDFIVSAALMLSALTACDNSGSQNYITVSAGGQTSNSASELRRSGAPAQTNASDDSAGEVPENENTDSNGRILIAYFTAAENRQAFLHKDRNGLPHKWR